ncbi:MAG: hypothetical protein VXX59_01855 [Candidatus Thermoplasmatota archaeon]|nr:hypothetical protein [Candidatus Thermoplasmatota archaeon]
MAGGDNGKPIPDLVGRVPDERGVACAELSLAVGPPAGDVLVVEDGAGMPLAGVDDQYRPACR